MGNDRPAIGSLCQNALHAPRSDPGAHRPNVEIQPTETHVEEAGLQSERNEGHRMRMQLRKFQRPPPANKQTPTPVVFLDGPTGVEAGIKLLDKI